MPEQFTDADGTWERLGPRVCVLVEPSAAWLDKLPAPEPPGPDVDGFINDMLQTLSPDRIEELMARHPLFWPSLERGNVLLAVDRLQAAERDVLTEAESKAVREALERHNIKAE
jgi:hypothetical protein